MSEDEESDIQPAEGDLAGDLEARLEEATTTIRNYTQISESAIQHVVDDIAANIDERKAEVSEFIDRVRSGDITSKQDLIVNLVAVAGKQETQLVAGAATGAYIGSFAGPIGSVLGAPAGAGLVYLQTMQDDRSLFAIPVAEDEIPPDADPIPVSETEISDSGPIMEVLNRAVGSGEASNIETRPTRTIDFDEIESQLEDLDYTQPANDDLYAGYYVEHDGVTIVLFIGEVDQE